MSEVGKFLSYNKEDTLSWEIWPVENPVCILQIVHGMSEYIHRYDKLANYLGKFGIMVCGEDHIGHGQSSAPEDYGYFGPKDGWKKLTDNVEALRQKVSSEHPGIPYVIMGHSMGSFITRNWLAEYGSGVDGAIIMGTAGKNPVLGIGMSITKQLIAKNGDRARSDLINTIAFAPYSKKIKNHKTAYDWLTTDEAIVQTYVEDPMCGFPFTLGGYLDMFTLLDVINKPSWYKRVPKDVPMLIIAGKEDPVGNYGKGPEEVCKKLIENGCSKASLSLYEGMRHELFNEYNNEMVMEELKDYILSCAE